MSERVLQIQLSIVAIIGTLFLGLAQDDLTLLYLVLAAAIAAAIFTDSLRWFQLPRPAANLVAILAVGFSLRDYLNSPNQLQLVAIANLLTYLQIILFFQEKQQRLYWQLITLSLLQVVVSAALSLGLAFGVLAVIYMFVMFSTIKLFFFLRETQRFQNRTKAKPCQNNSADAAKLAKQPSWKRILSGTPSSEFILPPRNNSTDFLRGISQHVLIAATMSLVFSATMFYGAPRLPEIAWHAARGGRIRTVGFSPQVSLNEMGQVLQDETVAMRVSFYDAQNRPYLVREEPYFRGAVLTTYGDSDAPGTWDRPRVWQAVIPMPVGRNELVRQVIRLEPTIEPALFGVFPIYAEEDTPPEVRFDLRQDQIHRERFSTSSQFQYALGTTGLRDGKLLPLVPALHRGRVYPEDYAGPRAPGWSPEFRKELTKIDAEKFPQLSAIAAEVLESANATDATDAKKARLLEAHFRDSERYRYSLQFNHSRDRELDPIEDFVANHRTGHCEYFASALALMLRSQDIPARVIVGYHGGEFNHVGNYWLVRQRHAHAWVEAYLEPPELLADFPAEQQLLAAGAWLRLDPTPGLSVDSARAKQGGGWEWSQVVGYLHFLWSDYVLGLNAERQRAAVYSPVSDSTYHAFEQLTDIKGWRDWLLGSPQKRELGHVSEPWKLEDWFNWRAAVLGSLVCAFGFGLWQFVRAIRGRQTRTRKLLRRLRGLFGVRFSDEQWRVEFYHRFEALCARLGWRRPSFQTQREFVDAINHSTELAATPAGRSAAQRIVETFYRIRFGHDELAELELAALNEDLRLVESSLEKIPNPKT